MKQIRRYEDCHRESNGILEKQCAICNEWFPCNDQYFYKNKCSKKDGLFPYCKPCASMRNYKWRLAHPESYEKGMKKYKRTEKYRKIRRRQYIEFKDKTKEWVDNNRDRVNGYSRKRNQNKSHNISDVELQELYEYCNYSCMYCGISEKEAIELYGQKLHRDHAYNNGSHGIENCVLACKQCNSSKRDLDWDNWFQYPNSKYSIEKFNKIENWLMLKGNENLKSE